MTAAGWTIMIVSVGSVLTLTAFCFYRVLTLPASELDEIKAPLDIDTGDTRDPDWLWYDTW
jgi:hypothetical protein